MHRPIVKYVVRAALLASTIAAVACSNATAPTTASVKKSAVKDLECKSGYTVINGIVVCNDPG
jgi:hypothetical protein